MVVILSPSLPRITPFEQLPNSIAIVTIYLSKSVQQSNFSASLAIVHSAVKWQHSFVLVNNTFDNVFCRNILESAKRVCLAVIQFLRKHLFQQIPSNRSSMVTQFDELCNILLVH